MPDPEKKKNYKVTFKHHLNERNQPRVTTALVTTDSDCGRGVAICSKRDPFNGKIGRKIAIGRAFKALRLKECNSEVLTERARDILFEVKLTLLSYKSHYIKELYSDNAPKGVSYVTPNTNQIVKKLEGDLQDG